MSVLEQTRIQRIALRNPHKRLNKWIILGLITSLGACGTTTQRLGTEQLLISNAVDEAISQINFDNLSNEKVYLDTTYLRPVQGIGFVNADYIISSLRQQLTASRCLIQEDRESADVIVEPRVGALGTDGHEVTYGVPSNSPLALTAAAFSTNPIPTVPEISFAKNEAQSGIAKVIVFAFDKETKQPIWQSGVAKSESKSSNTWVLGAGPFQKGTIYKNVRFAGKRIERPPIGTVQDPKFESFAKEPQSHELSYHHPHVFKRPNSEMATNSTAQEEPETSDKSEGNQNLSDPDESKVQQASHEESAD